MKIEVWSDIVCPWCYIGKRRLEKALQQFEGKREVQVLYRSFELDTTAPQERAEPLEEHLSKKYGMPIAQARKTMAHVESIAKTEGLEMNFQSARSGNTFTAHRLLHLAQEHHLQEPLKERFLKAYFTDGHPIGDATILRELAIEVGLGGEEVDRLLGTGQFADAVRADQARARQIGITGVPFFLINEEFGISGARESDEILSVLRAVGATGV